MAEYNLSNFMERLKRTQELPTQQIPGASFDAPQESSPIQMPQMGARFETPQEKLIESNLTAPETPPVNERFKLTDTDLSGPMKPETAAEGGMPYAVTKAGIDVVGGTINALAQSAFMNEEGKKKAAAEAMSAEAKAKSQAMGQTGAQQFGGLANLMDVYRGVYGGRRK